MRWRPFPFFLPLLLGELVLVGCYSFPGKSGNGGLVHSMREEGSPPVAPGGAGPLAANTGRVLLSVPGMT